MVVTGGNVVYEKLNDGTESRKLNDNEWSCQPRKWQRNAKVRRASKSRHVNESILEEVGVPWPWNLVYLEQDTPTQTSFDSKAVMPCNKDESEEWAQRALATGLQLCFSTVTLSSVLLWAPDCSTIQTQQFQESNPGKTKKTQRENRTFSFPASFLGARQTFPEFPQQISPLHVIGYNCMGKGRELAWLACIN